jgi:predicted nuclease of predicted toxin-antitoxin system
MRFLLDQGLPRTAAPLLNALTHDAAHVGDIGLAAASDLAILEAAARDNRVVVTLDADFHAIVAVSGRAGPSVIRIRIEGLRGPELTAIIDRVAQTYAEQILAGSLLSVDEFSIRARRLPIELPPHG